MSEWGWVLLGYVMAYGGLGGYLAVLLRRRAQLRRRANGLR